MAAESPGRQVLFLCTGNYYRSRFAEELFNHLALMHGSKWCADSMGFRPDATGTRNVGPISTHAVDALRSRGIEPRNGSRLPRRVTRSDLGRFGLVVALNGPEHRPMLEQLATSPLTNIRFWDVQDLLFEEPRAAMARTEELVRGLVEELNDRSQPG